MDKLIGNAVKKIVGSGEKVAPIKSLKLKVKFQKEQMASKMKKQRKNKQGSGEYY